MFMRQPTHRSFTYFPYYYKETQEEEEENQRIKFRRYSKLPRGKKRPVFLLVVLAVAVFVLWQYFGELANKDPKNKQVDTFEVEEVIVVE